MNIELLIETGNTIVQRAHQFEMHEWYSMHESTPMCKTAACIAGWGIALSKKITPFEAAKLFEASFDFGRSLHFLHNESIVGAARKEFDIDQEQARRLFFLVNWPQPFLRDWENSTSSGNQDYYQRRAEVAKARIEHFIETKGRE